MVRYEVVFGIFYFDYQKKSLNLHSITHFIIDSVRNH